MNTTKLITEIQNRNIAVEVVGDRLRFKPPSAITPELAEGIRKHKAELLDAFRQADVQTDSVADTDKQLAKFSKPGPGETIVLQPDHPLAGFDADSVFATPPRWIQHKLYDCQSTEFWQHSFGGFYCSKCWPCADAVMRIETDDLPEPRPKSGDRPKPKTEWTSEEELLIGWFEQNFNSLSAENFQHEINIAGLQQQLCYGPGFRDASKVIADLRLLKTDPERFHDLLEQRHQRDLNQWKPQYRREK